MTSRPKRVASATSMANILVEWVVYLDLAEYPSIQHIETMLNLADVAVCCAKNLPMRKGEAHVDVKKTAPRNSCIPCTVQSLPGVLPNKEQHLGVNPGVSAQGSYSCACQTQRHRAARLSRETETPAHVLGGFISGWVLVW